MILTKELRQYIFMFRKELEEYLWSEKINIGMSLTKPFPHGCCKNTSFLLLLALRDDLRIDKNKIEYVFGHNPVYGFHGWLEIEKHIIDITADQFKGIDEKVIIKPKDECSFHKTFKNQERWKPEPDKQHPAMMVKEVVVRNIKNHNGM